MIYKTN